MIGYTCAMLRYYYPLEFITAFLNNARTDEDIARGTQLAKEKGFVIRAPKFRYAQNIYTCDEETNTIYKGLGSIKSMQSIAADIMEEIANHSPTNFINVLELCDEVKKDNKRINSKSMQILMDIGFFSEYGNIDTINLISFWYNKYGKCKIGKKEGLEPWLIDIIKNCAEKETEKQFSRFSNIELVKNILDVVGARSDNIKRLISNQIEHLGYVDVGAYNVPIDEYVVQESHTDKYNRIWITLYHLASNQSMQYKCEKKWYDKVPCVHGDLLRVVFRTKEKVKLAGEDGYGRKLWAKTGEYENIISCYEIIKE